jgi:hypothetical protein
MKTKQEFLKFVKQISIRGKKLDEDVQEAALGAVYYSVCHGDWTIGQLLVETFSTGLRKKALVGFLEKYGQFAWHAKEKTVKYRKNTALADLLENREDSEKYVNAINLQWVDFQPEKIQSIYDCQSGVKSLLSKMEREIAATNAKNTSLYNVMEAAYSLWIEQQEEQETVAITDMTEEQITEEIASLIPRQEAA